MGKLLKLILILACTLFLLIFSLFIYVFLNPNILLTEKNIHYALKKSAVFQNYSFSKAHIQLHWVSLFQRNFQGDISNFCFEYKEDELQVAGCIENLKWNYTLSLNRKLNWHITPLDTLILHSDNIHINLTPKAKASHIKTDSSPYSLEKIWDHLFSPFLPESEIHFHHIHFNHPQWSEVFKLSIQKQDSAFNAQLNFNENNVNIYLTQDLLNLSLSNKKNTLKFKNFEIDLLENSIFIKRSENNLLFSLTALTEQSTLEVTSTLKSPLLLSADPIENRKKEFFSHLKLSLHTKNAEKLMGKYAPKKFNELPAPLNSLTGNIQTQAFFIDASPQSEHLELNVINNFHFSGGGQTLIFSLNSKVYLNLHNFNLGKTNLQLELNEIFLKLPQLEFSRSIPQLVPDSRFYSNKSIPPKKKAPQKKSQPLLYSLNISTAQGEPITLKSNLLENEIKAHLDFQFNQKGLITGEINLNPLKLSLLRRPLEINKLVLKWIPHTETPHLDSQVSFYLPEYKVILNLEGPVDEPRAFFQSIPPLPKEDILSVLLFGRPLIQVDENEQGAARRTTSLLSQGAFSLTTLYFLAGTSIESIGYDKDSETASAQIRLTDQYSLRVETQSEHNTRSRRSSATLRRSLGSGWYINSTLENSTARTLKENDFGVLLERVIAY